MTMKKAKALPKKTVKKSAAKAKPGKTLPDFICEALDSDKAENIVVLDLKDRAAIADFMIVATGTSSRHIGALATKLRDRLNKDYKIKARIEGMDSGNWVILDAGDILVHLFRDEVRKFYNIEKLWNADFATVAYTRYQ